MTTRYYELKRDIPTLGTKTGLRLVVMLLLMMVMEVNAWGQTEITDLSSIGSTGDYIIKEDIDASGFSTSIASFSGTLTAQAFTSGDRKGEFPIISNLSVPLFTTATDATISNIMLKEVSISQAGYVGAICGTANGATRIYNCGILPTNSTATSTSSIGSTDSYCGSFVGFLDGTARVINCYSYANITGGTVKAGIVGYNNYASKYNDLKTMVMNCMFYGDISIGGTISPIYGGLEISNDYKKDTNNRLNNYNYYLYEAPFSKNNTGNRIFSKYNCALAAEERFLVRFEFYRHLLNSTRELAAWYATGNADNGKGVGSANKMAKWVLDKSIAPYPILKEQAFYYSVVNYDPVYTYAKNAVTSEIEEVSRTSVTERNKGKNLGTLTVNISLGTGAPSGASISSSSLTLQRTDKDPDNYNFNYDKVQLPYYNEVGTGNYTENKVVTGWKVTVSGGSTSYSTSNYDAPNYNFADRDCTGKDNFATSGRVYSQGGYFNVPTGVTSISIEPYWGKAAYLSDACYDRYGYNNTDNLTQIGGGQRYTNNTICPVLEGNQRVYTTFAGALNTLTGVTNPTVYDYAVVLVGNYHHHVKEGKDGKELSDGTKPFTIMSIDLNRDNEPDYSLIFRSGKQQTVSPIRYDFINIPGMAMAHKMATNEDLAIPGNCKPLGWFEITTTAIIRFNQFEYSSEKKSINAPVIMMGGVIEQYISSNGSQGAKNTKYMLFGDNVWFKVCSNGCHMEKTYVTPRIPISITGGEYEDFYLSGYFAPNANVNKDNAECYIDGGKFGEVAGAGQEMIDGNVNWFINHADIREFYGGGINAAKAITGNITTIINNSYVDFFCGGPKFGNMASSKTVSTTATGTTFCKYFGAGYGGTSIYRNPDYKNVYDKKNYPWRDWIKDSYDKSSGKYKRGVYREGQGVSCGYSYEFFGGSANNVARLYILYASFSKAQTNNVTSTLTDCTVLENFYGGGSLGAVVGDATSTLTNTVVYGNAFGGGYSVQIPTVEVFALGGFENEADRPYYNESTAMYEKGTFPNKVVYTWVNETVNDDSDALVDDGNIHSIKTNESLSGLGSVDGNVNLIINGNSVIGTPGITTTGNVYGGGDESAVTGDGNKVTVTLQGNTRVLGNVFGGGNHGVVEGSTKVEIKE